jgi:hypothetical protein
MNHKDDPTPNKDAPQFLPEFLMFELDKKINTVE